MKPIILSILILFSASLFANEKNVQLSEVICVGEGIRENEQGKVYGTNANLFLKIDHMQSGRIKLREMYGHILLADKYTLEAEATDSAMYSVWSHYGVFNHKNLWNNEKYDPRKYKGYTQIPDVQTTMSKNSEGGMWGDFVLDLQETLTKDMNFDAHYIFQDGGHRGGTVDFTCTVNYVYQAG